MRVSYVADSHYAYYAARIDLQESVIELCKAAHAAFHDSTSSLKCQNIQKQQQARTSCCCCCASLMHARALLLPSSMAQARSWNRELTFILRGDGWTSSYNLKCAMCW